MKSLRPVLLAVMIVSAFSVIACSQKEDKKTRGTVNTGAKPIDGATAGLQQQYDVQALGIDILSLDRVSTNQGKQMLTAVRVGSAQNTIDITHAPGVYEFPNAINGALGALQVSVKSYCDDDQCNMYFIMIDAYQNGQRLYQLGVTTRFDTNESFYKIQPGNSSAISFDQMIRALAVGYGY